MSTRNKSTKVIAASTKTVIAIMSKSIVSTPSAVVSTIVQPWTGFGISLWFSLSLAFLSGKGVVGRIGGNSLSACNFFSCFVFTHVTGDNFDGGDGVNKCNMRYTMVKPGFRSSLDGSKQSNHQQDFHDVSCTELCEGLY